MSQSRTSEYVGAYSEYLPHTDEYLNIEKT
jgi:hypothetical protein